MPFTCFANGCVNCKIKHVNYCWAPSDSNQSKFCSDLSGFEISWFLVSIDKKILRKGKFW